MLNFLFFIWSGESISHVALSFRLSFNFTESLSLAYPLRLMKFSARDFNFQSLAEPIDVSFYMYMIEEVKILTTFIDVSKLDARLVLGAYSIVLNFMWSEQIGFFQNLYIERSGS